VVATARRVRIGGGTVTRFESYPPGVPCWVDTITDDLPAAQRFYGGLFGWEFAGPGPTPGEPPGEYFVARVSGLEVGGIGRLGDGVVPPPPGWTTHVAVASADEAAADASAAGGTVLLEPVDAAPAGRMAIVADPAGAALCLWQAGVRAGAQLVNAPSAWAMSLLTTPDPEGAQAFYGRLFGWEAEAFPDGGPGVSLFRLPGYVGGEPDQPVPRDVVAAMMALPDGSGPATWNLDFWIADADQAVAAAPGLGGNVIAEAADAPPFRRAVLAAPDGATFSVSELRLPA
jgi:predicted enzyme related to lactoylglutathione lyase